MGMILTPEFEKARSSLVQETLLSQGSSGGGGGGKRKHAKKKQKKEKVLHSSPSSSSDDEDLPHHMSGDHNRLCRSLFVTCHRMSQKGD